GEDSGFGAYVFINRIRSFMGHFDVLIHYAYRDQLLRVFYRERLKQIGIDYAEYGGVFADSQCQCKYRRNRERSALSKHSQAKEIPSSSPLFATESTEDFYLPLSALCGEKIIHIEERSSDRP